MIEIKKDIYWYDIETIEDVVWLLGTRRISDQLKGLWLNLLEKGVLDITEYTVCGEITYWGG